jgi:hypothetical protein
MRRLVLALAALVPVVGCGQQAGSKGAAAGFAQAPAPTVAVAAVRSGTPAPEVVGERTPLGDAPAPVAESSAPLDRSSPAAVLAALRAAVSRGDAAAIARLRAVTGTKGPLDQRDTLRSRIDFLGSRASFWERAFAAVDASTLAVSASQTKVTIRVPLGGAAASNVKLSFVKEGGSWLAGF